MKNLKSFKIVRYNLYYLDMCIVYFAKKLNKLFCCCCCSQKNRLQDLNLHCLILIGPLISLVLDHSSIRSTLILNFIQLMWLPFHSQWGLNKYEIIMSVIISPVLLGRHNQFLMFRSYCWQNFSINI